MFYYLYKITNNVNTKIYIGVHQTHNLDDNYMGSGKVIKRAILKYGIENFSKEIVEFFDNSLDMYKREAEIVTSEFAINENTYNIREGGKGGFDLATKIHMEREGYQSVAERNKAISPMNSPRGDEIREKAREGWKKMFADPCRRQKQRAAINKTRQQKLTEDHMYYTSCMNTEEAQSKKRDTFKQNKHQQGTNNNQYGTYWITNGTNNKKVSDISEIPEGYRRGRTL